MGLTGDEVFDGVPATVREFWAFALGDLRTNNTRGYLAEFLVHQAVGSTRPRVEWDPFDVLTDDGVRVEVKASGYLQSWEQRRPSRIVFSGLSGREWHPDTGYGSTRTYRCDVYVFCVQTARTPQTYRPLDVSQWSFHVVAAPVVAATGQRSLSLGRVVTLAGAAVPFPALADAIHSAHAS